jgi:outer membrane translocation and assembly module TamA
VRDKAKPNEFYLTRYDYVSSDVLVRQRFLNDKIMSISAGPSVYRYWNDPALHQSRILGDPSSIGLDSTSVFSPKFYAGGKAIFTVNNLDNEILPLRGINWTTELAVLKALNDNSKPFSRVMSTMDVYAVLSEPAKLLTALHFGGGHIFSDHFEYFQALTLGGNNYLRGFRSNRFAGSSMAYGSVELKVKLFDFNAYIIKGDLGLVGFNDVGRVWMKNEHSGKWHHGYGGGIYLLPFEALMVSAIAGVSNEDVLFNLTIGTKLNMVFQGR